MSLKLHVMIMSGVEDGSLLNFDSDNGDGQLKDDGKWLISIGRVEDKDICLRNDTFVSRQHAYLIWEQNQWWLQDCDSTNGSFIESGDVDARVSGTVPLKPGDLFKIGRTSLCIEDTSE